MKSSVILGHSKPTSPMVRSPLFSPVNSPDASRQHSEIDIKVGGGAGGYAEVNGHGGGKKPILQKMLS